MQEAKSNQSIVIVPNNQKSSRSPESRQKQRDRILGLTNPEHLKISITPEEAFLIFQQTLGSVEQLMKPELKDKVFGSKYIADTTSEAIRTNFSLKAMDIFGFKDLIDDIFSSINSEEQRSHLIEKKTKQFLMEIYEIHQVLEELDKLEKKTTNRIELKKINNLKITLKKIYDMLYSFLNVYFKDQDQLKIYLLKNKQKLKELSKNDEHSKELSFWEKIKQKFSGGENSKIVDKLLSSINEESLSNYFSNIVKIEIVENLFILNQFEIIEFFKKINPEIFSEKNKEIIRLAYSKETKDKEKYTEYIVKNILIPIGEITAESFLHEGDATTIVTAIENKLAICAGKVNIVRTILNYIGIPNFIHSPVNNLAKDEQFHVVIEAILPNKNTLFMDTNFQLSHEINRYIYVTQHSILKSQRDFYQAMVDNHDEMPVYGVRTNFFCQINSPIKTNKYKYPVRYLVGDKEVIRYTNIKQHQDNCSVDIGDQLINSSTLNNLGASISRFDNVGMNIITNFYKEAVNSNKYQFVGNVNIIESVIDSNNSNELIQAEMIIEEFLKKFENNNAMLFYKAKLLIKKGNIDEAKKIVENLFFGENSLNSTEIKVKLLKLLDSFNDKNLIKRCCYKIIELNPIATSAYEMLTKTFENDIEIYEYILPYYERYEQSRSSLKYIDVISNYLNLIDENIDNSKLIDILFTQMSELTNKYSTTFLSTFFDNNDQIKKIKECFEKKINRNQLSNDDLINYTYALIIFSIFESPFNFDKAMNKIKEANSNLNYIDSFVLQRKIISLSQKSSYFSLLGMNLFNQIIDRNLDFYREDEVKISQVFMELNPQIEALYEPIIVQFYIKTFNLSKNIDRSKATSLTLNDQCILNISKYLLKTNTNNLLPKSKIEYNIEYIKSRYKNKEVIKFIENFIAIK